MSNNRKITVNNIEVSVSRVNEEDFISLTDMVKGFEGKDALIYNWLRNRNTIEFLGVWEKINNPNFKPLEFERFKKDSGLNSFSITPKKWQVATNATGIYSKAGRYGGTYAHKDIAFEFGSWLSPEFKLYLIKEFQRLKEQEAQFQSVEWQANRELAKINYRLQTDAIQQNLLEGVSQNDHWRFYAPEADMINIIAFGKTAATWRNENPEKDGNQRDYASPLQNALIANLELLNSNLIKQGIGQNQRMDILRQQAEDMKKVLEISPTIKRLDKK
tara:strand:- start:20713 stop:21534 length:822 start_codon:yes stop_codon:yes gene_type:complete